MQDRLSLRPTLRLLGNHQHHPPAKEQTEDVALPALAPDGAHHRQNLLHQRTDAVHVRVTPRRWRNHPDGFDRPSFTKHHQRREEARGDEDMVELEEEDVGGEATGDPEDMQHC